MSPAGHTILLVEDNEDDVFLMKRALKSAGIINPLQVSEDGEHAIAYLDGQGEFANRGNFPFPLVVFLDLKLPKKSGFKVLGWLRSRGDLAQPVVVVLSSSNSPQDLERVTALGATRYAIKPPKGELFQELSRSFKIAWQTRQPVAVDFPIRLYPVWRDDRPRA